MFFCVFSDIQPIYGVETNESGTSILALSVCYLNSIFLFYSWKFGYIHAFAIRQ